MDYLQSILMGIVQGLTEFLPVSSSAHLAFTKHFLSIDLDNEASLSFGVILHLATLIAVLIYFRKDVLELIKGLFGLIISPKKSYSENMHSRLALYLIIATIPAGAIGLIFNDFVETVFSDPLVSALLLIVTAGMLFYITRYKNIAQEEEGETDSTLKKMTVKGALTIGLFQALAILPGISRSGSTIFAGLKFANLSRESAPRFAFLLSIPIILGAGVVDLKNILDGAVQDVNIGIWAAGFLAAFVSGYLAILWLMDVVKKGKLSYFGWYCLIVGIGLSSYFIFSK